MADEPVTYEVRDGIAHLTIDHGKVNALSPAVLEALDAGLTSAEQASEVGALVVAGRPGVLSGGFDLTVMRESPAAAGTLVTAGGTLFTRLYASPLPVVVACTGHAIAAGALLMMGADHRVGARGEFQIGLIETAIGMVLPRWAVELSEERIARGHLQQATVGARLYDPETAVAAGLLDAVADPGDVLAAAELEARRWAALDAGAYAGQVRMVRGERLARLEDALAADRGRGFGVSS